MTVSEKIPVCASEKHLGNGPTIRSLEAEGTSLVSNYLSTRTRENQQAVALHYVLCAQVIARRIYTTISKKGQRELEIGDVEQIAHLKLFQIVERFDVTRGVPFGAFIFLMLPRAVTDELRSMGIKHRRDRKRPRPQVMPISEFHENSDIASAALVSRRDPATAFQDRHFRREAVRQVPRELRLYIAHRYFRGQTLHYAAQKAGIGIHKAYVIQSQALPYLTKFLEARTPTPRPPARPARPARHACANAVLKIAPEQFPRRQAA